MRVKEGSEKAGLKLNIKKTKITESGLISSIQSLSRVCLFVAPWTTCSTPGLLVFHQLPDFTQHILILCLFEEIKQPGFFACLLPLNHICLLLKEKSPKPMSIESVMPSNHLILCHPFLLMPSIFPSIKVFSSE